MRKESELARIIPAVLRALKPDGLLWVSYPKGAKENTDLSRDVLRDSMKEFKVNAVSLVSVDDTWSALRFRPAGRKPVRSSNPGPPAGR